MLIHTDWSWLMLIDANCKMQNRSISPFLTPFHHFHFRPTLGLLWSVITPAHYCSDLKKNIAQAWSWWSLKFFNVLNVFFQNRGIQTSFGPYFLLFFDPQQHFDPFSIGGQDIWEISPQARPLGYWNWTWWIILNADWEICITPYFHIFSHHHPPHHLHQPNNDASLKISKKIAATFIKTWTFEWFVFSFV